MRIILFLLYSFLIANLQAQSDSTWYKAKHGYIISGAFLASGLIAESGDFKETFRGSIRKRIEVPVTKLDDFLQHSPILMMYGYDLAFKKSKEEVGRQTRHLLVTQIATIGTSLLLKEIVNNPRPNGGSFSFPSGHTSYSFASATVLFHSYKEDSWLLSLSGYLPASVVGAYRVIKDKHWVSDVLFGAGLGMLFGHLSYHLDIWDSRTIRSAKGTASPYSISIGGTPQGAGLLVTF